MEIIEKINLVKDMISIEIDLTVTEKKIYFIFLDLLEEMQKDTICPYCQRVIKN